MPTRNFWSVETRYAIPSYQTTLTLTTDGIEVIFNENWRSIGIMNPASIGYSSPITINGKSANIQSVLFHECGDGKYFIFIVYTDQEEKALLMKFVNYCIKNFIMPNTSREVYNQIFNKIVTNAIRVSLKKALGMEIGDASKPVQISRS